MFMRLHTALYHAFMSPLYAGILYSSFNQIYATRAPLGFTKGLPGRGLLLSPCGLPVVSLWPHCGLPWHPTASRGQAWVRVAWLDFVLLGSVAIGSIDSSVASVQICLLRGGLCRGIILLYADAMSHSWPALPWPFLGPA